MVDSNVGFLDRLEKNYEDFKLFDYEIEHSYLPDIFKITAGEILTKKAPFYSENCQKRAKSPEDIIRIKLKKDRHDNLYLMITGADDRTNLVIRKNNSDIEDYKDVRAAKVLEFEFLSEADKIQLKQLETANLPKRFIKKEIPSFNALNEFEVKNLISYMLYLRDELIESKAINIQYDEGEKSNRDSLSKNKNVREGSSYERANEVIDKNKRYEELIAHNPISIIKATGKQTKTQSIIFVYEKDDYYIGFIEPETGESFTKIVFIKEAENLKEIQDILLDKLSYNEREINEDNTIVRSSHTSFETFKGNLEYLLNDSSSSCSLSFKENVSNAFKNMKEKKHLPKV